MGVTLSKQSHWLFPAAQCRPFDVLQLVLRLLRRCHIQSGGNVISPSHTMRSRRKTPITAYYPAGYNCNVNMVETRAQKGVTTKGSTGSVLCFSKESDIWPTTWLIPPVGTLFALGADFSFAKAGGFELHQVASVGHQPPVSSLATVEAQLVPEEEAHLRRIFDETLLGNLKEVFKGIFGILLRRGDLR